jgi:spermidine synthase
MQSKHIAVYAITFFVAFCSIIYELIYSQLLTIIFGGTVLRYSVTIGLFLFSLGIGSFLYRFFKSKDKNKTFLYLEIVLSLVGFLGVVFIIFINSYLEFLPKTLLVILSNVPIILVGILSGLELPLLSHMVGETSSAFSEVLGMDYFGSLAGTFLYSMLFYPHFGLIFAVFVTAFFNLVIAIIFFMFIYKNKTRLLWVIIVLLAIVSLIMFFRINEVSTSLMDTYLKSYVQSYYGQWGFSEVAVTIKDLFFTPYQMVFLYSYLIPYSDQSISDTCLNIDDHIQLCDGWVREYHNGLVDVPAAFLNKTNNKTEVLIIGGGDGIAVNYLKKYNVHVDLVDIDQKFVEYSKNTEFIKQYNNNSFSYPLLNVTIDDGFSFLRLNNKTYDLILLDLPGLKEDKLLPLYSKEFFVFVNRALKPNGIVATWVYTFEKNPTYTKILFNTLKSANFTYYVPYYAYILPGGDDRKIEDYILISNSNESTINLTKNEYVKSLAQFYSSLNWQTISSSNEEGINTIFQPSYRMLIKNDD